MGFSHVCPTLFATTTASEATPEAPLHVLAQAWQQRHHGIPDSRAKKTRPQSSCFKEGTCMCKPQHRMHQLLLKECNKLIQEFFHNRGLTDLLVEGQIVLAWVQSRPEGEEDGAETELEVRWSYVALHYKKPWRPTLLLLELVPSDDVVGGRLLLEETCAGRPFNFQIQKEDKGGFTGVPAFRSWRDFVLSMAIDFLGPYASSSSLQETE